jgi:hypothetical protein
MGRERGFGIGGRLFLTLGGIAAGTVAAGVAATVMLGRVGDIGRQIAQRGIPQVEESLTLRANVGELVAALPSLARAESEAQRGDIWASLEREQGEVAANLGRLGALLDQDASVRSVAGHVARLGAARAALQEAVGERLLVADQRTEAVRSVNRAFDRARQSIAQNLESVQQEMAAASMSIGDDPDAVSGLLLRIVSTHVPISQALAELWGLASQALHLLVRSAQLPDVDAVAQARKEFETVAARTREQLGLVEGLAKIDGLRGSVEAVLARAGSGNGLFAQRERELKAVGAARAHGGDLANLGAVVRGRRGHRGARARRDRGADR